MEFNNGQKVTNEEVSRILGIGDQFLEDWEQSAAEGGDPEDIACAEERKGEWAVILPLLQHAPEMLEFVQLIARMQNYGDEMRDGQMLVDGDDAMGAMNQLIESARTIGNKIIQERSTSEVAHAGT